VHARDLAGRAAEVGVHGVGGGDIVDSGAGRRDVARQGAICAPSCQCVHLGVVLKGSLKSHYADGTEDRIKAGEAYVAHPGHTPELFPDTEVIEFSPAADLAKTVEVTTANMKRAQ
jgi:hypothetical protein